VHDASLLEYLLVWNKSVHIPIRFCLLCTRLNADFRYFVVSMKIIELKFYPFLKSRRSFLIFHVDAIILSKT
jgi:hypothetical protein